MEIDIVAIAKREDMTILDWIEYHRNRGISHIHIFDNNDIGDDSLVSLVKPYIDLGYVTIHNEFKGVFGLQNRAYDHAISTNYHEKYADWILLIDCDEYVDVRGGYNNIQDFMYDVEQKCDKIGVLYVNWECYTASHKLFYEPKPVTERFKEAFPWDTPVNTHIKSFIKNTCNAVMNTPHDAIPMDGKLTYDTFFRVVESGPYQEIRNDYPVYLKHYVTKSLQEYLYRKYNRISSTGESPEHYNIEYFFNSCGDREFYSKYINDFLKLQMSNIKTYITYFDDRQIEEYHLKGDDNTVLFKGNDTSYEGKSINNLNTFYCELCTMYYIWKNNLKSDYVVLKQYRRDFNWELIGRLPKENEVICYEPIFVFPNIIFQYACCHGKQRGIDLLIILGTKYGTKSDVYQYFSRKRIMYTNNSMVLNWNDFCKMCEFIFGILDDIDKHYGLNYTYSKYQLNAQKYTEDGRDGYQTHWIAYIGERLVSCYIDTYLKPLTIPRLEGNGFYEPYQTKEED